jgi:hypothetical protein
LIPIPWFIVGCLTGMVVGLTFPRLCPRCKVERTWIERTVRELKEKIDHKPHAPDS